MQPSSYIIFFILVVVELDYYLPSHQDLTQTLELFMYKYNSISGQNKIPIHRDTNTNLNKPITLSCPFARRVGDWASDIKAKSISHVGGYNCRKIAGSPFMSQHSFGKAIDVVSIDDVPVSGKWKHAAAEACNHFNNVLGPGSDKAHANHLHLDSGLGLKCLFD